MTDDDFPPRLRTQSNPRVKHLLDQVGRDGPSNAQVAATVAGVAAATGAGASRALGVAKWVKVVTVIGSAGLLTLGAALAIHARHASPAARPVLEQPVQVQAPIATVPREMAPQPAATMIAEPTPVATVETAAPVVHAPAQARAPAASSTTEEDSSMKVELQRVLAIRSSMLAKDPSGALSGVETYERDYPNGSFVPEAEAMAIEALNDAGRTDEARARADRFLERYGSSPQAGRIRALREKMK